MADYFPDSSGLVKRHVTEIGTAWVQGVCDPSAGNDLWVSRITGVEVAAAIWRRAREGDVDADDAQVPVDELGHHLRSQYRIVEVRPTLVESAMGLPQTHALRAYDAVQLASAIHADTQLSAEGMAPLMFISSDHDLLAAAVAEGLQTDNPNSHP